MSCNAARGLSPLDKAVSPTYDRVLPTRIYLSPVDGTPTGDIFFRTAQLDNYIYYRAITIFYMSEFQTNPNESGTYRILHATKWSKKGAIDKAMRLVVLGFVGREHGGYALRWQDRSGATFHGASFNTRNEAHNAFLRAYLRHNESYGPRNISHLPGIVK